MTAHGTNELPRSGVVELATKIVHIHIDNVRCLSRFHLPYGIKKFDSRNAVTAVEQKMFQQGKFFIGKLNRMAASGN